MNDLANSENQKIERIRVRRREAAAKVRSLLQQLETAEREFEATSRELTEAHSAVDDSAA